MSLRVCEQTMQVKCCIRKLFSLNSNSKGQSAKNGYLKTVQRVLLSSSCPIEPIKKFFLAIIQLSFVMYHGHKNSGAFSIGFFDSLGSKT